MMLLMRIDRWDAGVTDPVTEAALRHKLKACGYQVASFALARRCGRRPPRPRTARGSKRSLLGIIKITLDGESAILAAGDIVFTSRAAPCAASKSSGSVSCLLLRSAVPRRGLTPAPISSQSRPRRLVNHLKQFRPRPQAARRSVHDRQTRVRAVDDCAGRADVAAPGRASAFAAPNAELKELADAALATAKQAGASYADIRINRYRNQFIFTRDRPRAEHRQHRGLRLRRPCASSTARGVSRAAAPSRRTTSRAIAQAGRRHRQGQQEQSTPNRCGSPRSMPTRRRVEHAGEEGSRSSCRCSRRSICCCRSTRKR